MIWVRARLTNGTEVWLQRRSWLASFFFGGKGDSGWTDFICLDNKVNEIRNKLADKLDEVEHLLYLLAEEERQLDAEKDDIKSSSKNTRGFGTAYQADLKDFIDKKTKKIIREVYCPGDDWQKKLNPSLIRNTLGNASVKKNAHKKSGPSAPRGVNTNSGDGSFNPPKGEGSRTTYTASDLDKHSQRVIGEMDDSDSVLAYKEPKQGNSKKNNQRKKHQNQNNNNGQNR